MAQLWKTLWNAARGWTGALGWIGASGRKGALGRKGARATLGNGDASSHPRDAIIASLDDTIARSQTGKTTAAVFLFEIDRFRALEESLDSTQVARILRNFENRLVTGPCRCDTLRGLGGGRFAIVFAARQPCNDATLDRFAQDLHTQTQAAVRHARRETKITVSIGYATQHDVDPADGQTLFEAANAALLAANRKLTGATCRFSQDIRSQLDRRRQLARTASGALKNGQIQAYFQPQVDLRTNQIVGLEALARWDHKDLGILAPSEFLPILDECGLMPKLGLTMLRDALGALRAWDQNGLHIPTVSINMSTEELLTPNLADIIAFELDAFSISAERLVIEILETVVAHTHDTQISDNIRDLHTLGCAIDLDDFGTGHASITTIRHFSVDRIKIDRSFVFNIGQDEEQQQMVRAILTMSEQLRIATLAEGVETDSEIAFLSSVGCSVVQGYAVSRPMPLEDVPCWAQTHHFGQTSHPNARMIN